MLCLFRQAEVRAKREPDARAKRFTPPTLAEVQSYVAERHSPVDPQEFIDFYASKGWMVGKIPHERLESGLPECGKVGEMGKDAEKRKQQL